MSLTEEEKRRIEEEERTKISPFLPNKNQHICTVCGFIGKPRKVTRGNFSVELLLWLFFLIPGLIYSVWRVSNKYKSCPKCNSTAIIPIDTPNGRALLESLQRSGQIARA